LPVIALLILAASAYGQVLTITTSCPLPPAVAGRAYRATLQAAGGVPNYRWALEAETTFPLGISLDPNTGDVGGMTESLGVFGFLITATDSTGATAQKRCSVTVREAGSASVQLKASQGSLTANGVAGSARPVELAVAIEAVNSASGEPEAVAWRAEGSGQGEPGWLRFTTEGSTPGVLTLTLDPAGLVPGDYNGEVRVAAEAAAEPLRLPVHFAVAAPRILLSAVSLTFQSQEGLPPPGPQTISVTSNLEDGLEFRIEPGDAAACGWIEAVPSGNTTRSTVQLRYVAHRLGEGTHACPLTFRASRTGVIPAVLTATLMHRGYRPLMIWPPALVFEYQPGYRNPADQILLLAANGADFQITPVTTSVPWIRVSQATGRTPRRISVGVDPSRLTEGVFEGKLVINSPALAGPAEVKVTIRIERTSHLRVSPAALLLESHSGSSTVSEAVFDVSSSGDALPYQVDDPVDPWLSLTPLRGSTGVIQGSTGAVSNRSVTIRAAARADAVTPGVYDRKLRVRIPTDQESEDIDFRYVVNGGSLIIPLVSDGGGHGTWIYLVNPESATTDFSIRFLTGAGQPLDLATSAGSGSTLSGTIPAAGLRFIETTGTTGPATSGWAEITASKVVLASAVVVNGNKGSAAVSGRFAGSRNFLLPYDAATNTRIVMVNSDSGRRPAEVKLTWRDASGRAVADAGMILPARSQTIAPIPAAGANGFVQVSATGAAVTAIALDSDTDGNPRVCEPPYGAEPWPSRYRVFPGIRNDTGTTSFQIANPTAQTATVAILAWTPQGSPWSWSRFAGYEGSGEAAVLLAPYASAGLGLTGNGSGWAELVSTHPLTGCVLNSGTPAGAAPMIAADSTGYLFPFDNTRFASRLTLLNGAGAGIAGALPLTFTIRNDRGQRLHSGSLSLQPRQTLSLSLDRDAPAMRGTIELRSFTGPFLAAMEWDGMPATTGTGTIAVSPLRK
jgi:hypothetical protein